MDLQQLKYILAVAEELHFNKAAKKVGISQPTLSMQIQKLEKELGEFLFERTNKSVKLTEAGEQFIPYARSALDTLKSGVEELKNRKDEISGTIKVGFIPTIGPYLLPKVLQQIKRKAPKLKIILHEDTTSIMLDQLKNGTYDLGLLALPIDEPQLVSQNLGHEEFFLAVSKKHPLSQKNAVQVQHLEQVDLLMLQEGHCFRDQALDFCASHQQNPRIIFEGSSLESVMNLIVTEEAATLVPAMALPYNSNSKLKFIPFKNPKPKREIGLLWRLMMPLSPSQKFFIHLLQDTLNNK